MQCFLIMLLKQWRLNRKSGGFNHITWWKRSFDFSKLDLRCWEAKKRKGLEGDGWTSCRRVMSMMVDEENVVEGKPGRKSTFCSGQQPRRGINRMDFLSWYSSLIFNIIIFNIYHFSFRKFHHLAHTMSVTHTTRHKVKLTSITQSVCIYERLRKSDWFRCNDARLSHLGNYICKYYFPSVTNDVHAYTLTGGCQERSVVRFSSIEPMVSGSDPHAARLSFT